MTAFHQASPARTTWSTRTADTVLRNYRLEDAQWHYEHGLLVKAVAETGRVTGDPRYMQFALDWLDHFIDADGSIRSYKMNEFNLDQINPGKLLFLAYENTREARYAKAIEALREQIRCQPRNPSGGLWHKKIYPNQMWLDGIYMAGPFYAQYAAVFHDAAGFDDVAHQITLIEERTRDSRSGLLYHAWDESRQQPWADPISGCSPHFWGRALGWYAMALVDTLDFFPESHPRRPTLIAILGRLAEALVRVQDARTGMWYQVIDMAERAGNYPETSASAMFVYAFIKGVRRGYLPAEYLLAARRGYRGILENQIKVDAQGNLTLSGTCGAAGLGGQPYRDGSYEYYIHERVVTNDPKGVGPFILAALEMEAAGAVTNQGD